MLNANTSKRNSFNGVRYDGHPARESLVGRINVACFILTFWLYKTGVTTIVL